MEDKKELIVTSDSTIAFANDVDIRLDGLNEIENVSTLSQPENEETNLEATTNLKTQQIIQPAHLTNSQTTIQTTTETITEPTAPPATPPTALPTPSLKVIPTTPSATSLVTLPTPPTTPPATSPTTPQTAPQITQSIPETTTQSTEIINKNSETIPTNIQTSTNNTTILTTTSNNTETHDENTITSTTKTTIEETEKVSEVLKTELNEDTSGEIITSKLDSPETQEVTDKTGKNPFTKSGKLSRKADYIISHSTITRTNIRISDPDLPSQPIIQHQETEVLLVKPEAATNGYAGNVIEVTCVKVDSPETDKAEQVKLSNNNKFSCGRCCVECCCECCVECCGRCCRCCGGCCARCRAACSIQ